MNDQDKAPDAPEPPITPPESPAEPPAPVAPPPAPPAPAAPPAAGVTPPPPPPVPGAPPQPVGAGPMGDKNKMVAGLLAILLGALGIHKFYLGYNKEGIIMLAVSIVGACIGIGPAIMAVIGIVEGVMYLTKTDEEFYAVYVVGQKPWF